MKYQVLPWYYWYLLQYKERLLASTTMQGRTTKATYGGTWVPGYYKYCGYIEVHNQVIFPWWRRRYILQATRSILTSTHEIERELEQKAKPNCASAHPSHPHHMNPSNTSLGFIYIFSKRKSSKFWNQAYADFQKPVSPLSKSKTIGEPTINLNKQLIYESTDT